uniref:Uncharacterized protein n=1 Tax=Arundo donax TaxID=35708 RepID=A0A0A9B2R3_ARUDO
MSRASGGPHSLLPRPSSERRKGATGHNIIELRCQSPCSCSCPRSYP